MTRVLFIATNGSGLGHLTRAMAVARRLPREVEPLIFTTSAAISVVRRQGFLAEYFPPRDLAEGEEGKRRWDVSVARRLGGLLEDYDPAAVVFDGTYPYPGVVHAIWRSGRPRFVWSRRGMWRAGKGEASLRSAWAFDRIIEPGELASAARPAPSGRRGKVAGVPPVLFADPDELLEKDVAIRELGLSSERTRVLVQLGAGNINDARSQEGVCVARLLADPQVQLAVVQSPISGHQPELPPGVVPVSAYPVSRLYRAFDFVISAAGYNSYHELIAYGVPALFVPNTATALDDQVARARYAAEIGVAAYWDGVDTDELDRSLSALLDEAARERMTLRAREHGFENGAGAAAELVVAEALRKRGAGAGMARSARRTAQLWAGYGAGAINRRLAWALPDRATARLRRAAQRAYVLRKPTFQASTGQGGGTSATIDSVYDAVGATGHELTALLEELDRKSGVDTSRALVVTDSDDFARFRDHGARLEFVPPRGDWEAQGLPGDYESFLQGRIAEIADAHGASSVRPGAS